MSSIFDEVRDRRGTNSYKWDSRPEGVDHDVLPMWVADMDFPTAPQILDALHRVTDHGIFGYTKAADSLFESYRAWVSRRMLVELPMEWLIYSKGVLAALATCIQTLTESGEGIIIQPPVYHPFPPLITRNGRKVIENPLREENGAWVFDYENLDRAAADARALLLCSPHNPIGRVWRQEELTEVLEICSKHDLTVISDEIHSDIIMPGHTHRPLYALAADLEVSVVVLTSSTKTFNLAGIPMAWIIAPNAKMRGAIRKSLAASHTASSNLYSAVAAEAGFLNCDAWVDELIAYIDGNRKALESRLAESVPGLSISRLEGTYLAWLDFRRVVSDPSELKRRMLDDARLWLNDGDSFGTGGAGFQRLNLATSRSLVEEAAERIAGAFS